VNESGERRGFCCGFNAAHSERDGVGFQSSGDQKFTRRILIWDIFDKTLPGLLIPIIAVVMACGIPMLAIYSDYRKRREMFALFHQERIEPSRSAAGLVPGYAIRVHGTAGCAWVRR